MPLGETEKRFRSVGLLTMDAGAAGGHHAGGYLSFLLTGSRSVIGLRSRPMGFQTSRE